MHNFRELKIWKESLELAKSTLAMTKTLSKESGYLNDKKFSECIEKIHSNQKMINAFLKTIESKN